MSKTEKTENLNLEENLDKESIENEELKLKIAELEDKLLRSVAESQNIQKRAEKEKADISKYSISGFAKDVLSIRDNLQLALQNCSDDSNAVIEGVKLTMTEMDKILNGYGIKIIESLGSEFNPHFHQAMIEIETKDKEPGIIVQVMQDGFMIHDRLLRPALVGISKK